ncbi:MULTISPECIES: DUF1819 family protein [unclassified Shewanella]|uniref:DUF1819 family protein n=1 Tax=unclassified Shewanella TaxID=196818 RepID=UPI000E98CC55|nr:MULTISPECIES: DUF1819 family protein [unclassified Shewanella]MCU7985606.1 DUF1819 family protein [Shewanella sp. SW24]HAY94621.1 DUF1819 domain-containing protein [Shewanella sp.]
MNAKAYLGDIIGGSIMLRESRVIAKLLKSHPNDQQWLQAIADENILQKPSVHSAKRMASTVRKRIEPLGEAFWTDLEVAQDELANQLLLFAVMKQSPVLSDFMMTTVSDARRMYREVLRLDDWQEFINSRFRVIEGLEKYSTASIQKIGSNIFKILADAGFLESGRSKKLKNVYLQPELTDWCNQFDCTHILNAMEGAR